MNKEELLSVHEKLHNDRKTDSIKTDYGKCLIIAGSLNYPLSGLIVGKASLTTGCGYITYLLTSFNRDAYLTRAHLSSTFVNCNSDNNSFLIDENFASILKYDAISFGNGIEDSKENLLFLEKLIKEYTKTLIIDATGIKVFRKLNLDNILNHKCKIILTPHLLEADYLFDCDLKKDRDSLLYKNITCDFSKKYDLYLLIKSHNSLIVYQDDYIVNTFDTPSLAKAGSGDFYTGLLLGYLAYQKMSIVDTISFTDNLFHYVAKELEKEKKIGLITIDDIFKKLMNI